jgi:glucan phosphoethanolaminetransferase (alkaline phosphatase superfamily)
MIMICGLLMILLWGLPPIFSSEPVANFFGLEHAGIFVHWVRYFGMISIMWGIMLIAAAVTENKLVVTFSILLHIFAVVLTLLMMFWLNNLDTSKWIWWVSLAVSVVIIVLLIIFFPKKAAAKPTAQPTMQTAAPKPAAPKPM